MSVLRTVGEGEAEREVARFYEEDREDLGYVPQYTRVMALAPAALAAFEELAGAIAGRLGKRRYELATLAAARAIGSSHCLLAHGRKSLRLFPEEQLIRIARDYRDAGLSPAEVALMDYAERLSRDASVMGDADVLRLREHGFTDPEIVDIALAASLRNYYSRALLALGTEVDVPRELSPELQDALLGR